MKTGTIEETRPAPRPAPPARGRHDDDEGGLLGRPAGWWRDGRTFVSEVRNELRRVTWPSRKEVYATTIVVILVSAFFGAYLWAVDMVLGEAVQWIFRQLGAA